MFKNLIPFRIHDKQSGLEVDRQRFQEALDERGFQPCGEIEMKRWGWVAPEPGGGELVYNGHHYWLIALKTQERVLPGGAVNEQVEARAKELAANQGYYPGRAQMRQLREFVRNELIPKAMTKSSVMKAWIEPRKGFLAIDAPSMAKAEQFVSCLIHTGGDLLIKPLEPVVPPTSAMTQWLTSGELPEDLQAHLDCELRDVDGNGAKVRFTNHSLCDETFQKHLSSGKVPRELGLVFREKLSFRLTEDFEIKRIRSDEMSAGEARGDGSGAEFQSMFLASAGALDDLLTYVAKSLGGLNETPAHPAD